MLVTAIANRAGVADIRPRQGPTTQDTPLADIWTQGRILQFADGPDEVHLRGIARQEVKAMQEQLTRNTDREQESGRQLTNNAAPLLGKSARVPQPVHHSAMARGRVAVLRVRRPWRSPADPTM